MRDEHLIPIVLLLLTIAAGCKPSAETPPELASTNDGPAAVVTRENASKEFAEFEAKLEGPFMLAELIESIDHAHATKATEVETLWVPAAVRVADERVAKDAGAWRGFALETDEEVAKYLAASPPVWAPLIRGLMIRESPGVFDQLASASGTEHLTHLQIITDDSCDGAAEAVAKAKTPHLQALLIRPSTGVQSDGSATALALAGAADDLSELRRLELSACNVQEAGAAALANANLPALRELILAQNTIGDSGFLALANSGFLGELELVHLASNGISDANFGKIQAAWPKAKELDFANNRITGSGLVGLGVRDNSSLEALSLSGNALGEKGAGMLANSDLPALTKLEVARAQIGDAAAKLAESAALKNVEVLDLSENQIGNAGLLAVATKLPGLKTLLLHQNAVTTKGAKSLSKATLSSSLALIDLRSNPIDCAGVRALREPRLLDQLSGGSRGIKLGSSSCPRAEQKEIESSLDGKYRGYQMF